MKRPAFQFYPGDWQRDAALRACSVGARGMWIEMMCVMHQADPYGYLVLNSNPIEAAQLARMVGSSEKEAARWMAELQSSGVFSMDDSRRIFSRRMVRDEELRERRGAGGILGGNPALVGSKVNGKVNHTPTIEPTPSSSVFSLPTSTSKAESARKRGSRLNISDLPDDWKAFSLGERPDLNPESLFNQFVDHWAGVAGSKGVKLDWAGTWRNWVRREHGRPPALPDYAAAIAHLPGD